MKRCYMCKQALEFSKFYSNRSRKDGHAPECKKCCLATRKLRYKSTSRPYTYISADRGKHYKLSRDDITRMEQEQNGLCALCGNPPVRGYPKGVLNVDHDHRTGLVRALLCGWCNTSLGRFNDNPATMRAAAAYIEFHQERTPQPFAAPASLGG